MKSEPSKTSDQTDVNPLKFRAARYGISIGLWVVATIVATSIIWFGVSAATKSVISSPLPQLPTHEVARLAAIPKSPIHHDRNISTSGTSGVINTTNPTRNQSSHPDVKPAAHNVVTTTSVPDRSNSTTGTTTGKRPPVQVAGTLSGQGGIVNVTCTGPNIVLTGASPNDDFVVNVLLGGPHQVAVNFLSDDVVTRITAGCNEGRPNGQVVTTPKKPVPASVPPSTGAPTTSTSTTTTTNAPVATSVAPAAGQKPAPPPSTLGNNGTKANPSAGTTAPPTT